MKPMPGGTRPLRMGSSISRFVLGLLVLAGALFARAYDALVKFSWPTRMIDQVLKINGCGSRKGDEIVYTSYPSSKGAEVATYLHDNGHKYPGPAATELIVKFFQAHAKL